MSNKKPSASVEVDAHVLEKILAKRAELLSGKTGISRKVALQLTARNFVTDQKQVGEHRSGVKKMGIIKESRAFRRP